MEMVSISNLWMWVIFLFFIAIFLGIDLFLLGGRKAHKVSAKEALAWTVVWVTLALFFNFLLWYYLSIAFNTRVANEKALQFFTGYLIEKSLSVDNIFVFIMVFKYFAIPREYQRRVLQYGLFGAILLRAILIVLGLWLVTHIHWILYIFGVVLIYTGARMLVIGESKIDPLKNPLIKFIARKLRITAELHDERFFIWRNNLLYFTPLFMVLLVIETSDLIFAIDSIPAIFAVTQDPFIVFTSNIFAILGLRALFFLLADIMERFHYLKYGLGLILVFIGMKMLLAYWYKIPVAVVLGVMIVILIGCIALSYTHKARKYHNKSGWHQH